MMFEQNLRYIQEKVVIHPPWEIQCYSFSSDEVLGLKSGEYLTIKQLHVYELACGHLVRTEDQLGGKCEWCYAKALQLGDPHASWISLYCKNCFHRCIGSLCGRGICFKHAIQLGGERICPICVIQLVKESERKEFSENWGNLALKAKDFYNSLFFK